MKPTIVFDVNETLLDLSPVRTWFAERFGDDPSASEWFGELLRLSFVSATTDRYIPFPDLGAAALVSSAARFGASVGDGDLTHIVGVFTSLPAHPDVESGLEAMRGAGFTVAALTNSPQRTAELQLANAGISDYFHRIMSVEMVHRFKPHRSVYEAAATSLGAEVSDLTMVAAHDWDIAGAMAAGCDGVFVARPGQTYSESFPRPTMTAQDIRHAADQIIANRA
jgi:2-haloacid dehalogenase